MTTEALSSPATATPSTAEPGTPVPAAGYAKFRRRLHAWWNGYYLPADTEPDAAPKEEGEAKADGDTWTAQRIKVAEMIWGDGFTFPGGVNYALDLVKPMKLTAEKSFLDIGCGLGGATRAIAKTFGVWCTGLEASDAVATAGMRYSEEQGLAPKAPVSAFDPKELQLPANKYDAICVRKVISRVGDKKPMLAELAKTLKPNGHLMILDYALRDAEAASPALKTWRAGEDVRPLPGTLDEYRSELVALDINVRIAADETEIFRAAVGQGWSDFAELLKGNSLDPEEARALAKEISLWGKRLAAIDSGDLRVVRLYGLKKAAAVV